MKSSTKELKKRGTLQFPFEGYPTDENQGPVFINAHWHEDVEIIHVKTGVLYLNIEGTNYILSSGDFAFINSGLTHFMHTTDSYSHYDAYVFPLQFLSFSTADYTQINYLQPLLDGTAQFPLHIRSKASICLELSHLFSNIIELDVQRNVGFQLKTKILLYEIIALLFSHDCIETSNHPTASLSISKKIIAYIDLNYAKSISLYEISSHCNLSPKYFCQYFKLHFGKTFIEYLNEERIEKSCIALLSTNNSVLQIALDHGFQNISYFNKCFKKSLGLTPSQYRKPKTGLVNFD